MSTETVPPAPDTLPPFATPEDIALGRPLTEAESALAAVLLDRASLKLRLRVPGIDELVAADPLRAQAAKLAVVAAVERVLKNPDIAKQVTETAGPFSRSFTPADSIASGLLYFTADDLFGLAPTPTAGLPRTARVASGYPAPCGARENRRRW